MNIKQFRTENLTLKASKGFAFNIPNNIVLTTYPSIGIIYFLQCSVKFFDGETYLDLFKTENPISNLYLRNKTLAIGQKMPKGQLTTTTVLDLQTKKTKLYRYQKSAIEFLSLSCDCQFLASVGSTDNLNQQFMMICLFQQLEYGFKAILQEQYQKKKERIIMIAFSNNDPNLLAVVFANKFSVFTIIEGEKVGKKVAKSSKVRQFSMAIFDSKDISCYVCSKNGDISDIDIKQLKQNRIGPKKRVIISGIKHIRYVKHNKAIITGVKGFIGLIELIQLKILKQVTIKQQITSLTQFEGDLGFASTKKGAIYILNAQNLEIKQFYTCHSARVNQVCFLDGYSQVFATCADNQIILWRNYNLSPIIKISLPNTQCLCLNLLRDGSSIVSGWSDDCIRFFNPKTGKKINQIKNAQTNKVTAMASSLNSDKLFSGGEDGQIRCWKLQKQKFGLIDYILVSHKAQIHYLKLHGQQLYACSQDGHFSVWNTITGEKKSIVKVSNFLRKIILIDEYTVYAVGGGPYLLKVAKNDGKILQRQFIGGSHLNDFDIFFNKYKEPGKMGSYLVFGGELHSVFVKQSEQATIEKKKTQEYYAYGQVTCVKFSPDYNTVIAATADGTLICYEFQYRKTD